MMSFRNSLSSSTDSDILSDDRWSTTRLMDALPPSISSTLSSTSSNNAENSCSVSLAFTEVLLPPLRSVVSECMANYFQEYPWIFLDEYPGIFLDEDPIKKTALNRQRNRILENGDDLAFCFLEKNDQRHITSLNLDNCGDVRVLLKIMIKAGCFQNDETQLATKLKEFRDQLAHQNLFSKEFMKMVFDQMLSLLEAIESNHKIDTSNYQRKLKQLRKFGAQKYLKKNKKGDQLSSLRSSLLSSSEQESTLIDSLIDATITDITQEEDEYSRKAIEVANSWATMNDEQPLYCHEFIFKSNKGNKANLDSLLRKTKHEPSKVLMIGNNFKMSRNKFAEGSTRIAYRGHFEGGQSNPWFVENPEVVLKKSYKKTLNTTDILMKIRSFSSVLVEKFNILTLFSEGSIKLLDLLVLRDEDMTMEPYIDHTSYTKWSNNNGFVNIGNYEPLLDAFSHWTHQVTNGQLIVVDLQGTKKDDVFFLTDLAIHSATGDFGSTNRRVSGIAKFFKTHVCNQECKSLGLTRQ